MELAEFVARVSGDGAVQGRQGQVRLLLRMLHLHERKHMFYLTTHSTHFIYKTAAPRGNEMFYLTMHSIHFIYKYAAPRGRKQRVYLMTHSTHFIYENAASHGGKEMFYLRKCCNRPKANVLFNNALNTFSLQKCCTKRKGRKCFI